MKHAIARRPSFRCRGTDRHSVRRPEEAQGVGGGASSVAGPRCRRDVAGYRAMNVRPLILAAALIAASPAMPHDFWQNGEPVPAYVKSACCGPADAHHIKPDAVHIMADGVHIDGITTVVPVGRVLPSPDGEAWGFWSVSAEPDPVIFCLFLPPNGV